MREGSAESAKKRKFVFFRSRSQRKADEVRFELSRFRSPHGTQRTAMCLDDPEFGVGSPPRRPQSAELWHSGQKYVVRVTAVLEESRWGPRRVGMVPTFCHAKWRVRTRSCRTSFVVIGDKVESLWRTRRSSFHVFLRARNFLWLQSPLPRGSLTHFRR